MPTQAVSPGMPSAEMAQAIGPFAGSTGHRRSSMPTASPEGRTSDHSCQPRNPHTRSPSDQDGLREAATWPTTRTGTTSSSANAPSIRPRR